MSTRPGTAISACQAALMLRLAASTVARPVPTGPAPLHSVAKPEIWWTRRGRRQMKQMLAERDGGRCLYCRRGAHNVHTLTFDHYVPQWLGKRCAWPGLHELPNLVLACEPCNTAKLGGLPWPLVWLLLTHQRAPLALAA